MNRSVVRCATAGGPPVDSSLQLIAALSALALSACGTDTGSTADPLGNSDAGLDGGAILNEAGMVVVPGADSSTPNVQCTASLPNKDSDGDGFTGADGDCNDCDKLINPGAFDFPGNAYDEDCSGSPAEQSENNCDMGLDMASTAAQDAARAIGLCKFTTADKRDWGVIDVRFTTADGSGSLESPLQVGLLPKFGVVNPLAGGSLLALSSGVARAPGQPGFTSDCDIHGDTSAQPPAGYPKVVPSCKGFLSNFLKPVVFNQAALEVKIRVPSNANSLGFDSIFYSYEYPNYICSEYNDFYVAFMEPKVAGADDGNIVFDSNKDPIGINTGLLAVCDKAEQFILSPKKFDCPQGIGLLKDTGYGRNEYTCDSKNSDPVGGASTGWLHTLAPAVAGSVITLRFAIWDTNDSDLDSTVLVDNFVWSVDMPTGASTVAVPILL